MNLLIISIFSALSNCQRLLLVLGIVGVLASLLFNSLVIVVDRDGWSSGFTHPLHGGDHFLTMLAVGIWAAQLRGKAIWLLPLTFVGVMSLGGIAGAAGLFISSAELIILLSGLVFSVLIVRKIRFSSQTNVIIVAFFAFFHGFAHGQEISTSASLISYTLGFMVATLLLHGAGILVAKLIVLVFALLLSHLVYAQSSTVSHDTVVKSTVFTQTDKSYQFFMMDYPAPPDGHYQRQRLDDDGGGGIIQTVTQSHSIQNHGFGELPVRALDNNDIANHTAQADLFISPQVGIRFLTNGVGVTAPPSVLIFDSSARCCFAAIFCHTAATGNQVLATTRYFNSIHPFYNLAIRLLSNGVGVTSPPVSRSFAVVDSLNHSARFTSTVNRTVFFKNLLSFRTRFKSRSPPPFAFHIDHLGHEFKPIL